MSGRPVRRETLFVGIDGQGERLDLFVVSQLDQISRKAVKRALDSGRVFVDGAVERRANRVLQGGETVSLTLEGEALVVAAPELEVLYRDDHLLAVNKPAALPSHPTAGGRLNALDLVRQMTLGQSPILLHRLDADTTGVLLFALNSAANRDLARQFAERQVSKTYLALVAGQPPARFSVCNHLKAGVRGRTVAVVSGGDRAETAFRTLSHGSGYALVEACPKTGRTHQIRAHSAGEGYPLLGDALYGGPSTLRLEQPHLLRRHLLHAFRLVVNHPATSLPLILTAPLPDDFLGLWDALFDPPALDA